MTQSKFNIGDIVYSRRLGNIAYGQIISLWQASATASVVDAWDEVYPDWRKKYVYVVNLDRPVKIQSFVAYCGDKGLPQSRWLYDEYLDEVQTEIVYTFPEDDLITLEEIFNEL